MRDGREARQEEVKERVGRRTVKESVWERREDKGGRKKLEERNGVER